MKIPQLKGKDRKYTFTQGSCSLKSHGSRVSTDHSGKAPEPQETDH